MKLKDAILLAEQKYGIPQASIEEVIVRSPGASPARLREKRMKYLALKKKGRGLS